MMYFHVVLFGLEETWMVTHFEGHFDCVLPPFKVPHVEIG